MVTTATGDVARTVGLDSGKVIWQAPGLNHKHLANPVLLIEKEGARPVDAYPIQDRVRIHRARTLLFDRVELG